MRREDGSGSFRVVHAGGVLLSPSGVAKNRRMIKTGKRGGGEAAWNHGATGGRNPPYQGEDILGSSSTVHQEEGKSESRKREELPLPQLGKELRGVRSQAGKKAFEYSVMPEEKIP